MNSNAQVITFGCRLNIYESQLIEENLRASNLKDVAVFNTCTVTAEAEKQIKKAIRKFRSLNPNTKIIVTGCAAQINPQTFADMPEVDKLIGNQEKLIPQSYTLEGEKVCVNDIMSVESIAPHMVQCFSERTRAFVQIQNGCNHRCTFCIIPYARGNSRSVPIGVLVDQLKNIVASEYQEIVFTGVDLTSYGQDLPGTPSLAQMIKRVLNFIPDIKRLRLSSIDIAEVDEELFELMSYESKLMPHFHVSLQSGDNMILKRMKRRHNREQVIKFCNDLRARRSEVSFGADLIAGFPTETEAMFNNTLDLITSADLQYLHVFPYSERPGTPASKMPQIDKNIRKSRAAIIRELGQSQLKKFFKKHLKCEAKVLLEKNNFGYTENFIPVRVVAKDSTKDCSNTILKVQLLDLEKTNMIGKEIQ